MSSHSQRFFSLSFPLLFLIFFAACATEVHQKIKLDIPAYSPVRIQDYDELTLIPFIVKEPNKEPASVAAKEKPPTEHPGRQNKTGQADQKEAASELISSSEKFDLNAALMSYFQTEFSRRFPGKVKTAPAPLASAELIHSKEHWSSWSSQTEASLVFTGQASFNQEVRKAILFRPEFKEDELFGPEKGIGTRVVFTLELNIVLLEVPGGKVLLEKNFKENKITPDIRYPARFALYELTQRAKFWLFRLIFGEEKPQERYLLRK